MRFLPTTFLLIVCSLFPIATKPEELQNQTDFDNGDGMNHSQSSPCPSSATDGLDEISEWCKFWLQGILLTLIGLCGIVGNLVSVFVLTRPCMLSTFNLILAFMTAVDTIFLVSSIIEYSIVQAFKLSSLEYDKLFVYFLYPTHNVTLVCSIYLHVVMAFERYLAVCHPELVYAGQPRRRGNHQINSEQESKTIRKKALTYIIPVLLCSILINLPKWFELEIRDMLFTENEGLIPLPENVTVETESEVIPIVAGTWLRYNEYYITYYMHWTLFLITGLFPLAALFYLNLRIYLRLKSVRQVRTGSTKHRSEPNYAATLASIIVIFIICHMPRLFKTIYELLFLNFYKGSECSGIITPAKCLPQIINLVLVINASSGFLIYCFIGTFGEKFLEVLKESFQRVSRATNLQIQVPVGTQGQCSPTLGPHQVVEKPCQKMTAVAFMANGQSGETLVFLKKANGGNEINQAADYSENGIVTIEVVDQQYKYAS